MDVPVVLGTISHLNRTSVGLKQLSPKIENESHDCLNRTSVGLKRSQASRARCWSGILNRTSVGLKPKRLPARINARSTSIEPAWD